MQLLLAIITASWDLLLDASAYVILGIAMAGLLKSFLPTDFIAHHLGRGRILPIFKAALLGIPLPICSCGVMPAAASLKKHGASNGATIAFMVSTPESGVDSIAASYALLDPLLTVARPVAALFSALVAGIVEEIYGPKNPPPKTTPDLVFLPLNGAAPPAQGLTKKLGLTEKIKSGLHYAFTELWGDLAPWFIFGILLSGVITALVPEEFISRYLSGGPMAMLIMLAVGIPMYICATASTPIAAALIMKGVSPGAALVFLLTGPATNLASLAMLTKMIGKRGTSRYLLSLATASLVCGFLLDLTYRLTAISSQALVGQASELLPHSWRLAAALLLIILCIQPLYRSLTNFLSKLLHSEHATTNDSGCGCPSDRCGD